MVKFTSEQKSIERMYNMVLEEKKVKNICNFLLTKKERRDNIVATSKNL